jgi:N-acetylneuraminic acid mutarotase
MKSTRRRADLLLVCLAILLFYPCVTQAQEGHWEQAAQFPEPSQEIGGAGVGDKVFILGGLINGQIPKNMVWEYDSGTNTWTKKKDIPLPSHHLAAVGYNGKLYVFGGGGQIKSGGGTWVPLNNAWEFDPENNTWKALAPMPTRRGAAVAAVVDGKIYVLGGAGYHPNYHGPLFSLSATVPHRAMTTNEMYDPATNTWEERSPMPTPRNHTAIGVANGKIYVLGGRLGSVFVGASATDVVEEYDPATNSWSYAKARMPMPRSGTAFGSYGGKIYVAGGEYLDNDIVGAYRDLDAYDPATNTWKELPPLAVPRHGLVGAMIGNRFYVVSGHMQSGAAGGSAMDSPRTDVFVIDEP